MEVTQSVSQLACVGVAINCVSQPSEAVSKFREGCHIGAFTIRTGEPEIMYKTNYALCRRSSSSHTVTHTAVGYNEGHN